MKALIWMVPLALIAIFVWPSLYSYTPLSTGTATYSARISRLTGSVAIFDGTTWRESGSRSRWLTVTELAELTGTGGFEKIRLVGTDIPDFLGDVGVSLPKSLEGPFAGRLYNGTSLALERVNFRITAQKKDGGVIYDRVYSASQAIEPLTVREFSFPVLRCDSAATWGWTIIDAYGRPQKDGLGPGQTKLNLFRSRGTTQ